MLFVGVDPCFADHDPGRGHPERPARLEAVHAGIDQAARDAGGETDALVTPLPPRDATTDEITRVHTRRHVERLEAVAEHGGGTIDPDTSMSAGSLPAAVRAAGAGLAAVDALTGTDGDGAFLALRPPGHHARPERAMGFCLLNNVAITAAALADRGDRVLIVDYDAHHGNGTQEIFYDDARVAYVSLHEWPLYPGTGRLDEIGANSGIGTTCNVPLPAGATGDLYLRTVDELVAPLAATQSTASNRPPTASNAAVHVPADVRASGPTHSRPPRPDADRTLSMRLAGCTSSSSSTVASRAGTRTSASSTPDRSSS